MLKYFTLFVVLIAGLSSCSKNPLTPENATFLQPKLGSSFTFDDYNTDTITGLPVPKSRDTSVHTVVQTGLHYMGKTNVTKVISISRKSTDTLYVNYEANNNISEFVGGTVNQWITVPTGTKTSISTPLIDTTIFFPGDTLTEKITMTASFIADENLTVKGQSLKVSKIQLLSSTTYTSTFSGTITSSQTTFFYFAPSLGYIAKSVSPSFTDPIGGKQEGSISMLFDYTLKN